MVTKKETKVNTREKLLDVAEQLFSEQGFDGVSVRDITDAADVRLASVNYHFETKKQLFYEVIKRRADRLNTDRRRALDAIPFDELDTEDAVKAIVSAFIDPMYLLSTQGGDGWKNYCRLIAQQTALRSSSPQTAQFFNPVALEVIKLFQSVVPGFDEQKAHYAFQYLVGAMIYIFAENERLDVLSDKKYSSHDLDSLCSDLVTFVSAGILALASF